MSGTSPGEGKIWKMPHLRSPWNPGAHTRTERRGAWPEANPRGERCPPALALQRQKRKEWEVRRLLRVLEQVLGTRYAGASIPQEALQHPLCQEHPTSAPTPLSGLPLPSSVRLSVLLQIQ